MAAAIRRHPTTSAAGWFGAGTGSADRVGGHGSTRRAGGTGIHRLPARAALAGTKAAHRNV